MKNLKKVLPAFILLFIAIVLTYVSYLGYTHYADLYISNKLTAIPLVTTRFANINGVRTMDRILAAIYDDQNKKVLYVKLEYIANYDNQGHSTIVSETTKLESVDINDKKNTVLLDLREFFKVGYKEGYINTSLVNLGDGTFLLSSSDQKKVLLFNYSGVISQYGLLDSCDESNLKLQEKYFLGVNHDLLKVITSDGKIKFINVDGNSGKTKTRCGSKDLNYSGVVNQELIKEIEEWGKTSFSTIFKNGERETVSVDGLNINAKKAKARSIFDTMTYRYTFSSNDYPNMHYWVEEQSFSLPDNYILKTPKGYIIIIEEGVLLTSDGDINGGIYLLSK